MSLHFENGDVVDNRPRTDSDLAMITEGPSGKAQRELRAELAVQIDKLLDEHEIDNGGADAFVMANMEYRKGFVHAWRGLMERLRPELRAIVLEGESG